MLLWVLLCLCIWKGLVFVALTDCGHQGSVVGPLVASGPIGRYSLTPDCIKPQMTDAFVCILII